MHQKGSSPQLANQWQSLTRAVFLLTCAGIFGFALLVVGDKNLGSKDEVSGHIERIERHHLGARVNVLLGVALNDGRHISFSTYKERGYHNGDSIVVTEHHGYAGRTTFAV